MDYLTKKTSDFISEISHDFIGFIKEHDPKTIILGGGNTPKFINEKIIEINKNPDLFKRITFAASDERHCDDYDPANNCSMLQESLFSSLLPQSFLTFKFDTDFDQYLINNQTRMQDLPTADLAILGIGNDGHTASLFPGHFNHEEKALLVDGGIGPEGLQRISFSLNYLLNSKNIWLLCNSAQKKEALERFKDNPSSPLHWLLKANTTVYL